MDWGALVRVTLRLYQQVAKETWEKIWRAWWVGLLPLLYAPLFLITAGFVAPLGFAGGLILGLVLALCTGSYLYFIAGVVNGNRMRLQDLVDSWRPYFGPVITILFFLFVVRTALSLLLVPSTGAQALVVLINLVLLIILNPIPEIIYQGRSDGFGMLQESVEFLRESGIEWFVPFVALALFSFLFLPIPILMMPLQIGRLAFPTLLGGGAFLGAPAGLLSGVLSAFILFVLMVFRGLLFRELARGTRRQRIFRSRFE